MLFLTFFLLFIVVGYPIWDYFYMKKINSNQFVRWRLCSEIMFVQWGLVIILLIFWSSTDRKIHDLFIYTEPFLKFDTETLVSAAIGVIVSILNIALIFRFSKSAKEKVSEAHQDESIQFLIPKTPVERFLFFWVSVTAGVCEEIIFRGLMLYYFSHLPFDLSIFAIGLISSLLFGIVHLYQGWKGVLQTAYLGAILFFLYVGTGTLWVPIVLHFLIDVKFVFLPNKESV